MSKVAEVRLTNGRVTFIGQNKGGDRFSHIYHWKYNSDDEDWLDLVWMFCEQGNEMDWNEIEKLRMKEGENG